MPSSERFGIGCAIIAAALLVTPAARANGRFPRALRFVEDSNDNGRLVLAATYGLVITSDRGRNWYHLCETAFSMQNAYNGDPVLSIMADGSILVGVQSSLNVSHDRGCAWTSTLGARNQTVIDFSVAPSNPNLVVAVVTTFQDGGTENRLQESSDAGNTWTTVGAPLPVQLVYTIDLDPTDPTHIFATGLSALNTGIFLRSTDHGATWSSTPIPHTNIDEAPYIAAVHPTDPRKIFVRTDAWTNRDIIDTANDALLYSNDGGQTWTEILRQGAKLYGFALSPDGSTVLAGYGDPVQDAALIESGVLGIYRSPIGDFAFSRIFDNSVTCLAWTKTGLYACTSQIDSGFELGFASDANLASCPLTPILRLSEIRGELPACPAASAVCDYATACTLFDSCPDGGRADAASASMVCSDGSAGGGSSSSDAAPPLRDASATSRDAMSAADGGRSSGDASPSAPAPKSDDGGGCSASRKAPRGASLVGAALSLLGAVYCARSRARAAKQPRA
jgi:photosystem II stability/assembly factor-like uncharacterized protein